MRCEICPTNFAVRAKIAETCNAGKIFLTGCIDSAKIAGDCNGGRIFLTGCIARAKTAEIFNAGENYAL